MIDLHKFAEKRTVVYWSGGKPASEDDFSIGEIVVVKANDGTRKRCVFSRELISFLEKCLDDGNVVWVSIARP